MPHTVASGLFGEVQFEENEVYWFEQGLPGFPQEKKFLLLRVEDSPFTVLHSATQDLYFFMIDPFSRFADYEFSIPEHILEMLEIEVREHVACYSIAVLRDPLDDSTVNLVAPIILNAANRKGIQLVLENTSYAVRHPLGLQDSSRQLPEEGRPNQTVAK